MLETLSRLGNKKTKNKENLKYIGNKKIKC